MSNLYIPFVYTKWVRIRKTAPDFSTASSTNTIPLITLPAKSAVVSAVINPVTAFTGGLISGYTISIDAVSVGDIQAASSVFTVPARPIPTNRGTFVGTIGSTQDVFVTATSTVGTLDAATQGTVDIYLLVSQLE